MGTQKFRAKLQAGGEGGAWTILRVPFSVEKEFGTKGRAAVKGTLNGFAFRTSLFPAGDGTHHMMVNRQMQEGAGARAGDTVDVAMELDTEPRAVAVPRDFQRALAKNQKARAFFEKLAPSHKRAYVEAIEEAKKPETRARRIERAVTNLAAGKK
jgi:hypothetical protein